MTSEIEFGAGWLNRDTYLWCVLGWAVVVLLYGLYRSRGKAAPDAIRPSGPLPEA
jgi:hypothetical protein